MPQEPKKRHSRQRQGKRRAAIKYGLPTLVTCQNCQSKIMPHRICPHCGFYKGIQYSQKTQAQQAQEK